MKPGDFITILPLQDEADRACLLPREGLARPIFIVDDNVARLARILRALGFDAYQQQGLDDPAIVQVAKKEGRIILTRDKGLLKRRDVVLGFYLRSTDPYAQAQEVIRKLRLHPHFRPLTRCLECNVLLRPMAREEQDLHLHIPRAVREAGGCLYTCDGCLRPYWEGSHFEDMQRRIGDLAKPPVLVSSRLDKPSDSAHGLRTDVSRS